MQGAVLPRGPPIPAAPRPVGEPVEQLHKLAEEAVQKVLTLSPELAEAHSVRAWLEQYKGEWRRAEFGYFAATSMDPNDVTTRIWYSGFLVAAGKLSQGQAQADRALELEPGNPLTQAAMAMAEMVRGDNEACVTNATTAREMDFTGRSLKGMVYVSEEGFQSDEGLMGWINRAYDFVKTLPAK